jgi:hypothetical protein
MTASARVLPFRPLPHFDGPPDTLMTLLEACEGLPDVTVARLVDHYFGDQLAAWQAEADEAARLAFERRYADGHTAGDFTVCANPRCLRCWQLTPEHEGRAVALRETGSRPTLREIADE